MVHRAPRTGPPRSENRTRVARLAQDLSFFLSYFFFIRSFFFSFHSFFLFILSFCFILSSIVWPVGGAGGSGLFKTHL